MKWLYAAFDLGVVAGPLLATCVWLRDFWQQWRAVLLSIVAVGVPWALMDVAAHYLGWWSYNQQYILGLRIFGLPIEEVLFFMAVPLACLVVWHIFDRQKGSVPRWLPRVVLAISTAACFIVMAFYVGHPRTVVDAAVAIATMAALWDSPLVARRAWWYWNIAILILFLICNTILTAVPIVMYDVHFMTGWRIGTIPIEDFLYNFSLLNLLVLTYGRCKKERVPAV